MKNAIAKQAEINQELTTLIDENLQQEQELLKSLIKEILEANEKIKNAHFERVQDTEAKLKVLNAEVKRIRRTIKKQDDTVTKKRLQLLAETKSDYFDALGEIRLSDVKDHFSEPLRKHLNDLERSFADAFKKAPSVSPSFEDPLKAYLQVLSDELSLDVKTSEDVLNDSYDQLNGSTDTIQDALSTLTPFAETVFHTFKEKLDLLLSYFDTSELDDLIVDIQATTTDDLQALNDQTRAIDEALHDEFDRLEEAFFDAKKKALDEAWAEANIAPSEDDLKTRQQCLDLEKAVHQAASSGEEKVALKELKAVRKLLYKSTAGKSAKKIDRAFKKDTQALAAEKQTKRHEHLEQTYEIRMQKKEREIQSLIDMSSLKMRTLLSYLENQEDTLLSTFAFMEALLEDGYALELALYSLAQTTSVARFKASERQAQLQLQKTDLLHRYQRIVQRLEVEALNHLERQHAAFRQSKIKLDVVLEKERLELNRLFGTHKILDARVKLLNKSKIKRLDELKGLKFQLFQDESDIELAEKEYDIQVLKAQALYDHERALNKVQSERIDAGVRVNKAMVQATVKRQVNFADQQIKFAEAEYAARMEHIDYTLNQEMSYAEETLGFHEKNYAAKKAEIEQDYETKVHSIAQKKKLFEHSAMLKKVLQEEKDVEDAYAERLGEFNEQMANDETIRRYRAQIQKAHDHAEKARNDATALRQKDIDSFTELKRESLDRLANVEKMMAGPEMLPYHDDAINDQASERLNEMLATADNFLHEKIDEPKKRLQETQERLLELEKGDVNNAAIVELNMQEKTLNAAYSERLRALEKEALEKGAQEETLLTSKITDTETLLQAIDSELANPLTVPSDQQSRIEKSIEAREKALDQAHEALISQRLMAKNERLNTLMRVKKEVKNQLVDVAVKTQMKVEKIEALLPKAMRESYKILHKSFKKDRKNL